MKSFTLTALLLAVPLLAADPSTTLWYQQPATSWQHEALPDAWPHGKVTGLRARGGHHVDIEWKDGKLISYKIRSQEPTDVKVRIHGETKTIRTEKL